MSARKPSGFTLVELMVVVGIISVLIALLIPAVLAARESARRNQCINNQHQLAVALKQYETEADRLPGWVNSVGDTADGLTWAAMLSPHLGMNDVWSVLRETKVSAPGSTPTLPSVIPGFLCPTDSDKKSVGRYRLSYVGNCGSYTSSTSEPQQGILTGTGFSAGIPVRTDEIPDGAQNTLLFSENVDATQWFTWATLNGDAPVRQPYVVDVGMLWTTSSATNAINSSMNVPKPTFPTDETAAGAYRPFARPSSYHPGGVVVTFCDGHQDFVSDRIEHDAYLRMLNPDG